MDAVGIGEIGTDACEGNVSQVEGELALDNMVAKTRCALILVSHAFHRRDGLPAGIGQEDIVLKHFAYAEHLVG